MSVLQFSDYSSTLVDADLQRRINLYLHSKLGTRMLPGEIEYSNLSAPTFVQSGTITGNLGITFARGVGDKVYSVTTTTIKSDVLGTDYDLSTIGASATSGNLSMVHKGLWVRADELKVFACGELAGLAQVRRYGMTAGDVTTLATEQTFDASGKIGTAADIKGVFVRPDGTTFWVADQTGSIHEYAMADIWEITSGVTFTRTFNARGGSYAGMTPSCIRWNDDGTKFFLFDQDSDKVIEYLCATPWRIDTGVENGEYDVSGKTTTSQDVTFGNSGVKMYVQASTTAYEYDIPAYTLSDGSAISGVGRAMEKMNSQLYVVIGASLYSVSDGGGFTSLGTIVNDGLPVGMATDGTNLVIAANSKKYNYTVAGGLVEITDTDLGNAYTVAYLDLRFWFDQGNQFASTDLSDPTSVDPLYFATAEAFGDIVLAEFVHNQLMYACGTDTIEVWYTTGVGKPTVDRQFVIPRGLIGRRAIDRNERRIYILDHDRRPTWIVGNEYGDAAASAPGLGEEFDSYTTVDDCVVNCYTWEQEFFAEYSFPTQDVSWLYHERSDSWTKRENASAGRANSIFYVEVYNKLLGLDRASGKLWNFSGSNYQLDGSNFTRTVDTEVFSTETMGLEEGLEFTLNRVRLTVKSSTAATVSTSLSTDLATFGTARDFTLVAGINTLELITWGIVREGILRFTTTTNAKVEIQKVEIFITVLNA